MKPVGSKKSLDLPNRSLKTIVILSLIGGVFFSIITSSLPNEWGKSGGPILQSAAVLGALLLLSSFVAVLAKRFGGPGKYGFRLHVWLASIGSSLVLSHSIQNLSRPPAILLLMIVGLIILGLWGRTKGSRLASMTFGEKRGGFAAADPDKRQRLYEIIQSKGFLLESIEASAQEAEFSLKIKHYLRSPIKAFRYRRLAAIEEGLTGAKEKLSRAQIFWRLSHRLLAWAFIIGLFLHVVIVMFFAKYAANGGEPYWFHFLALDF